MRDHLLHSLAAGDADRILDLNNEHAVETSSLDLTSRHCVSREQKKQGSFYAEQKQTDGEETEDS